MRKITLHEVGMENYGPYIDPMILPFPNDNVTLLTGPNGVGKTMALDAIPFTLFGTTSKGLKGDDLVNNVVDKKCYTWVKFSINKDQYLVKRYQKYAKFGGNNVVLNKNGVDIKSGSREVIPEIERLWCTQKSFKQGDGAALECCGGTAQVAHAFRWGRHGGRRRFFRIVRIFRDGLLA